MDRPVRLTLFTPEEADRLLPELKPELERLARMKREFDRLERRLEVLSMVTAGASQDNSDRREQEGLADRRERLGRALAAGVTAIQRRGPVVKDLEAGLVDFYALLGDRLVFLCWRMDEPKVGHWHTLEGGFTGRQPIGQGEAEE
jgi:hypothetical protein